MVKKEQKEWGIAGDAKAVKRTITLSMSDTMRFSPDLIEVKQGDTIKLVMKNDGKQLHELVIGTKKELDEHAALMIKFPNMEHDEPYQAHVPVGKTAEIIEKYRLRLETVCERCGKFAELRKDNGFYLRCDACEAAILISFIAMRPQEE